MRPARGILSGLPLALCLAMTPIRAAAPVPEPDTAAAESPWVVVDYSSRSGSYRVVGEVALLSQRYSPGNSFHLIVAAVALNSGVLTETTEIACRTEGDGERNYSLTMARALQESNDDFFSQVLKRTSYEPIRDFLVATRYTPGVPEAVASFAELARGEPLRVTVFEQNLFLQAFTRRELPLRPENCAILERVLSLPNRKGAWGQGGMGEVSAEPPRHVSWFNGVAQLKDGTHVITVAAVTTGRNSLAQERFLRYLSSSRR
jgi:beta-lactamase class D